MIDQTPGPGRGIDPLVRLCRTYDPLLGPNAPTLSGAKNSTGGVRADAAVHGRLAGSGKAGFAASRDA